MTIDGLRIGWRTSLVLIVIGLLSYETAKHWRIGVPLICAWMIFCVVDNWRARKL